MSCLSQAQKCQRTWLFAFSSTDFATEFAKSLPARFPYESLSDLKVVSFGTSVPLGIGFSVDNDFPGLPAVDAVEGAAEEVRARARAARH